MLFEKEKKFMVYITFFEFLENIEINNINFDNKMLLNEI